jgi:hypothetical protein
MARAVPLAELRTWQGMCGWKATGRREDRQRQLEAVVAIGAEMTRLTRLPGLRLMLKMMRAARPSAAGLSSLQRFLEPASTPSPRSRGSAAARKASCRRSASANSNCMNLLFEADPVACETELRRILGQAR